MESKRKEAETLTESLLNRLGHRQQGWERIYLDLAAVKAKQLFKELEMRSFTQYVNYLAVQSHCQPSYIWRTWNAGKYFQQLAESRDGSALKASLAQKGQMIGDEVLSDVKRITGSDHAQAVSILEKFAAGTMTKSDIKRLRKAQQEAAEPASSVVIPTEEEPDPGRPQVKLSDILIALNEDAFQLYRIWKQRTGKEAFHLPRGERSVYEVLPSFRIQNRTMDALVISNVDSGICGTDQEAVTLRCVEIRVREADLDPAGLPVYEAFANACYLAVPDYLLDQASQILPADWGLLSYNPDSKKLALKLEAQHRPASEALRVLQTLAVKKLQSRDFYNQ